MVRLNPVLTSPSTVQISLFSYFSRHTIFYFAPCSTASTRAMESFQRKPNGGNSSSAAPADDTARQKATNPVGRIRLIARLPLNRRHNLLLVHHFSSRRIHFRSTEPPFRHSEGGKNARARQFGQLVAVSQ